MGHPSRCIRHMLPRHRQPAALLQPLRLDLQRALRLVHTAHTTGATLVGRRTGTLTRSFITTQHTSLAASPSLTTDTTVTTTTRLWLEATTNRWCMARMGTHLERLP